MGSKKNGDAWERDLIAQNSIIESRGLAKVAKLPDPVRITSRAEGRVIGYPTRREWPDFWGILKGGSAVAFEAKSTAEESRFPLSALRNAKPGDPSQHALLWDVVKFGGIAFVALRWAPDYTLGEDFVLPVTSDGLIAGFSIERPSIPIDELGAYSIKPGETWFECLVRLKAAGRLVART